MRLCEYEAQMINLHAPRLQQLSPLDARRRGRLQPDEVSQNNINLFRFGSGDTMWTRCTCSQDPVEFWLKRRVGNARRCCDRHGMEALVDKILEAKALEAKELTALWSRGTDTPRSDVTTPPSRVLQGSSGCFFSPSSALHSTLQRVSCSFFQPAAQLLHSPFSMSHSALLAKPFC
ncbi:hypothetical protein BGZ60DRAFT_241734 [Tricladium varicosporioides]|nr:hypothetical protein BGZ60DRAFT_241734 [Hymenoscyphus varicosporioides]